MNATARNSMAGAVALVAAFVTIFLTETAVHAIHGKPPAGAPLPESAFVAPIVGYGLAALVTILVVGRLAASHHRAIVTSLLAGIGILAALNLLWFPHPWWFLPATAATLFAGWWIGNRLAPIPPPRP